MTCEHKNLVDGYYGHDCADCGELVYPYGCAPWDDDEDYSWAEYSDDWDEDDAEWDDMPHVQPPVIRQWDLLPSAAPTVAGAREEQNNAERNHR